MIDSTNSKPTKLVRVAKPDRKKTKDYLDNIQFTDDLERYALACQKIVKDHEDENGVIRDVDGNKIPLKVLRAKFPVIPNSVANGIVKISKNLSNKPNFIGYTYKDEMVFDGIENCIKYIHNFDRSRSANGFAYATQIMYYAFIRRIKIEHKQSHIKQKLLENLSSSDMVSSVQDGDDTNYNNQFANNMESLALRNHRPEWD